MAKKGKHFRALDEARAAGYEVFISHFREPYVVASKHGRGLVEVQAITVVKLYRSDEDEPAADGYAQCSVKHNFNRRLGVQIACGRALKQAQGR